MGLKVAFQMDPIAGVDIDADSTFRLAEEAQARGHALFVYGPDRLALDGGRITARGHPVTVRRMRGDHVTFGAAERIDLASRDVVWLRQDPPFDMGYITTTLLLEMIPPPTLVVNDPAWVRNRPEKLTWCSHFPDLMPPTTVIAGRSSCSAPSRPSIAT
jgi:glutathione synthase